MGKVGTEKKIKSPPEKFWQRLVDVYFQFYKMHFRDNDGFQLTPDWSGAKVGMESKGLKGIIIRLRNIAEEKEIEWTEEYAVKSLEYFLKKAYNNPFLKKSFMCCLLNKFKDSVIVSEDNSSLVSKILEVWYFENKEYTRDYDNDRIGAEKVIAFLKNQYTSANIVFADESVLSSFRVIVTHIKTEEFWENKSLKSISNNLQEFVNKIKSKHGPHKAFTREGIAAEFNRRYSK